MSIQELLIEIKASGLTDAEIGAQIGAPQSIVTRLRNGNHKQTDYERGMRIAKLAKKLRARKSRATQPTVGDA
jgi:hypothetical protein